jgi:predicted nucleotidyltransferase
MLNLSSNLRKKLLGYYFSNADSSFYVRELAKILQLDPTNLSRELYALERIGLFEVEQKGNSKFYKLNKFYPTFRELKALVMKTVGVVGLFKQVFKNISGVDLALLYGSFATGREDQMSDIDLLIVSDHNSKIFYDKLPELEKKTGREVNLTIYSAKEFSQKKNTDPFLLNVLENKYEIITGKL